MKLTIGDFEVEVKVTSPITGKYDKEETMYFLNHVSIACGIAEEYWNSKSGFKTDLGFGKDNDDIVNYLKGKKFYDQI